jgi:lysophospholipase L1-like esterase
MINLNFLTRGTIIIAMNTNPNAKRILCFGDSYTWGYSPASSHERVPSDERWTGVLQNTLGIDFEIIEEGLNSRTLNSEDPRPDKEGRNGKTYLIPCLDSHDPIDLVILMLGTNELKDRFKSTIEKIGNVIESDYVKTILGRKSQFRDTTPQLLLISPPILNLDIQYAKERYADSREINLQLAQLYKEIAQRTNCLFLNSAEFVEVGADGVHFEKPYHKILGEKIADIIKSTAL